MNAMPKKSGSVLQKPEVEVQDPKGETNKKEGGKTASSTEQGTERWGLRQVGYQIESRDEIR